MSVSHSVSFLPCAECDDAIIVLLPRESDHLDLSSIHCILLLSSASVNGAHNNNYLHRLFRALRHVSPLTLPRARLLAFREFARYLGWALPWPMDRRWRECGKVGVKRQGRRVAQGKWARLADSSSSSTSFLVGLALLLGAYKRPWL